MAVALIGSQDAQLGAVTVSDNKRRLEILVSDDHGYRSTVTLWLDAEAYAGEGQQQLAERVAVTLHELVRRAKEADS